MKRGKTWRDIARPIIAATLEQAAAMSEKEKRKALREAYPFGQREHHPYKIWLDEIKVQMKKKRFPNRRNPFDANQQSLFTT
jgi:hypothetical protein